MSYEVIARRWRPQDFTGLIGQDHIRTTLINALKADRLHHALLFTGPRGTGKTSTARILAKALRCPNPKGFTPCNTCSECQEIAAGTSVNVIEIDGASNNGVDAIRELRDTVGYLPSSGRFKMYIIDEVHMLSTSAFNALLKTLEEPPGHVYFVMATTEVHKIPATILSRCQRFDFRRINTRTIADHLKTICERDKVKFEADALWTIARQGDGSMRDAQSLLDQVINFCGGELKRDLVVSTLGLTDRGLLLNLLSHVLKSDAKAVINDLTHFHQSGGDPKLFLLDVMEQIRNTLLLKLSDNKALVDLPDSEQEALAELGREIASEDLHWAFDMALKGAQDLTRASDPLLVLEMVLMRMTHAPRFGAQAARPVTATAAAPMASAKIQPPVQNFAPAEPVKLSTTTAAGQFDQLVRKIKEVNGLVGAQLENCFVVKMQDKAMTLGVSAKHKFLFDKISQPDFKKKVVNYLNTFWGPGYTLEITMGEQGSTGPDAISPKAMAEKSDQENKMAIRRQVEADPLVQQAKRIFKAEIKSIKEFKQ